MDCKIDSNCDGHRNDICSTMIVNKADLAVLHALVRCVCVSVQVMLIRMTLCLHIIDTHLGAQSITLFQSLDCSQALALSMSFCMHM